MLDEEPAARAKLDELVGDIGVPPSMANYAPGAYNRVRADATAFVHRAERFLLKHEVIVDPAASEAGRQAARDWISRSWEIVHPCGSGGVYPNFPDPELEYGERAYHGANLHRLRLVKATYDPESVFRFDHSVEPHQWLDTSRNAHAFRRRRSAASGRLDGPKGLGR